MISFPNAKINLGLHVVSKRQDGYHNLETIFYPVKLSDALEMIEAEDTQLTITGIEIDGSPDDNLIIKAYNLLKNQFQLPPVHFHLHKVIPFGAGLGGGSSDAAFALKMLNDSFHLKLNNTEIKAYAAKIGADCSFFIDNVPSLATGIGDELSPVQVDLSEYNIIIIKPRISVSTPEAYRHVVPAAPQFSLSDLNHIPVEEWKNYLINDFEKSVFKIYPEIEQLKFKLYQAGAVYASMSGSGSALFGIFRNSPVDFDKYIPGGIFIYP